MAGIFWSGSDHEEGGGQVGGHLRLHVQPHHHRLPQPHPTELHQRAWQRRAEQPHLPALTQPAHDLGQLRGEAELEQAVGLVEDEELDVLEGEIDLEQVVEEAAGGGDDEGGEGVEGLELGGEGGAADEQGGVEGRVGGENLSRDRVVECVCSASSRVGDRINARTAGGRREGAGEEARRLRRGMRKAADLPLPVRAMATTSAPDRSRGWPCAVWAWAPDSPCA